MKSKILLFILGSITTLTLFYMVSVNTKEPAPEQYTPSYISNEDTGASARIMEADIIYYDTDNDGVEESIILYNCYLCNTPPREMAIIDDDELVFFYEGGNLEFIPVEPGAFIIKESNVPRDGRKIETSYHFNIKESLYTTTPQ